MIAMLITSPYHRENFQSHVAEMRIDGLGYSNEQKFVRIVCY